MLMNRLKMKSKKSQKCDFFLGIFEKKAYKIIGDDKNEKMDFYFCSYFALLSKF